MPEDIIKITQVEGGFRYYEQNSVKIDSIFISETTKPGKELRTFFCNLCKDPLCHHVYCVLEEISNA